MTDLKYFDRDLSWLSFNYRVLQEAKDQNLPLYERIKFLAIYSSNLDEFYRVRVASILSLKNVKKKKRREIGLDPQSIVEKIHIEVEKQLEEFGVIFREQILPELHSHGIHLLRSFPELPDHQQFIEQFFDEEILPFLHPEILMKNKIVHFLRDKALYLVVKLRSRTEESTEGEFVKRKRPRYALVQIPTHYFARFIQLPKIEDEHVIMFLDDIIKFNLHKVFPGFEVVGAYSVKLSRNADLLIEDEFDGDLVSKIQNSLKKRQVGAPARFLFDVEVPKSMLKYLRDTFNLKKNNTVAGGRYHNFSDFFGFPNPLAPALTASSPSPLLHPELSSDTPLLKLMEEKDFLLHFPYQTYDHVLQFFNEISKDPEVTEIYTTQYRVASDSAIVNALISAALNQKTVTVFVEIKARFDEATNLKTAMEMSKAGVNVIYSMPGLKVHAKVALAIKKDENNEKHYAFLSTGNFNEKTAKIYADHGLLTTDQSITSELMHVFNYLRERIKPPKLKQILVAQFNLRPDLEAMIDSEIEAVKAGKAGYIIAKVNNLEDKTMINKLYEASKAGVTIDLIVRGICCLIPGIKDLSENITIRRIVGTFLEHARVFIFYHGGAYKMYMGSADWMQRNLSRRIEVVFPVKDPQHKAEIMEIIRLQLEDNSKAVILDAFMTNNPIESNGNNSINAQLDTYERIESQQLGSRKNLFPILP